MQWLYDMVNSASTSISSPVYVQCLICCMLQDKCIVIIVFQGAVSEKMVSEYISYTDGPMTKIAEYVINE